MPRKPSIRPGEPIREVTTKGGEIRYDVRLETGDGRANRRQVQRRFVTLKDARAFVVATRADVERGAFVNRSATTVRGLLTAWLSEQETRAAIGQIRPVTVGGYATWAGPVVTYLGDTRITDVDAALVREFIAWALREGSPPRGPKGKTRGLSPRAVRGSLQVLSRAFDGALERGEVHTNPVATVSMPRLATDQTQAVAIWGPEELAGYIARFVAAVDADDTMATGYRLAMHLAAAGLRRSEACGLTWDAGDVSTGTVAVLGGRVQLRDGSSGAVTPPKSAASRRFVPVEKIATGTSSLLKAAWFAAGQPAQGLAVPDRGGQPQRPVGVGRGSLVILDAAGRPVRPEYLSDVFHHVVRDAGLPQIHLHALRHSWATAIAHDPKIPNAAGAAFLGHTLATFEARYAQRSLDAVYSVATELGAMVMSASA